MTPPPKPPQDPASEAKRFGAEDEAFWQNQEARLSGQLGQPCCTLSGMCTLLGGMAGDFAVIIHGERDCGNSFVFHRMVAAERFFCTCLTEDQLTSGRVDEPLESCLRLVLEELAPEVIIVLGTCPITMIGADPGPVVDRVAADTETPILLLRTGGLKLSTQADMVDWLYASLAGLPQVTADESVWRPRVSAALQEAVVALIKNDELPLSEVRAYVDDALEAKPTDRNVNLIGLPADGIRFSELGAVLRAVDIQVTGLYPFAADLRDWRSIGRAALNVVADRKLYPRLLEQLEGEYDLATVEVPLPIGLKQSEAFYRSMGEFFGAQDELDKVLAPHLERAQAQVASFRKRARSTTVAMGIRMLNNYRVDQLAYEGLGDVEALAELGFDLTLLIQGPPEERPHFEKLLAARGVTLPMHVFPSPWNLAPLLSEGGYEVAYLADHSWEEAQKAGVPMIRSRALMPMLTGVEQNLKVLTELLKAAGRSMEPEPGGDA